MKKKHIMGENGFTLIELLAVILILGVIALIAIPIVGNIIKEAKQGAAEASASNYIEAVEKKLLSNRLVGNDTFLAGSHDISDFTGILDLQGMKPTKGTVSVGSDDLVTNATLCINNYKVEYADGKCKIYNNNTCDDMASSSYEFDDVKGVNRPVLATGMTPVKWDASNNEVSTTSSDPNWYDYANKKWANAKTKDGSYWVWIPRYAYKITSGYHSTTTGAVSIKFLKGTTNTTPDNTKIETSGYAAGTKDTSTNYFMHPSFDFNGNILGYWVAKFEPTAVEGVSNGYTADGTCSIVGDNVTTKTVKVIQNAISWRCIDMKIAYNLSLNMKNNSVYGWKSGEVDTHVMKNTEWGAIVYLTQSTYGGNAEIWINNANNFTTGCAANSVNQGASTTGCLNAYNTVNGVKSSTTLNITGIYDMSGGSWERTMGNYNNLASGGFNVTEITNLPNRYVNRYTTISGNLLNNVGMDYDNNIYGDAIYETSTGAARYNGSALVGSQNSAWYAEQSVNTWSSGPWFARGGYFGFGSNAGLFDFSGADGAAYSNVSFRPIVFVAG
jgi:type IV pilus assembly protein PilA